MPRWSRVVGLAVAALAAALPSLAQDIIPRKTIFGNPERTSALISPDGAKIAFLAPVGGVLNVFVGPADNLSAAKAVTGEKSRPVRMLKWAPNGTHIVYLQDVGGNENYNVFSVDLTARKTLNLTDRKNTRAEILETSYRRPNEILIGLNDRDPKWHDVWRIDVTTGKSELVETNRGMAAYVADEDLDLRLALKTTPDGGMDVFRRETKAWRLLFRIPADDALTTYPLGISGDGKSLLMLDSRSRDKAVLTTIDVSTGSSKVIGENAKADVANAIFDPVTNDVMAFSAEYHRPIWSPVGSTLKPDLDFLTKNVPGVWDLLSQSKDNRFWTLRIDNVVEPVKFALYDRTAKKLSTLFVGRPALTGASLAPMYPRIVKSRDGLDLVSYLTLPPTADANRDGKPDKPLAMVLNVHGGPWARDSFGYDPEHQWLANRGYAVLSVNFRGSTGFGKSFVNAADREWAGKMQDDLVDAARWAVREKIALPGKIAIYGGSYGGFAALTGLSFTPKTFACGVSIVGPSNLNTLLASVPPYWASLLDIFKRRVGDPGTPSGRKLLTERSPLFRAGEIERPLLIAQGANDPRVKQAEADQIVDAMQAQNIPVTYLLYADEGHGFARPENRMSFYAVAEAFLSDCLGGRFQPIGRDFEGSSIAVPAGREFVPGLSEALGAAKPD